MIYFDQAASSFPKPKEVVEAVSKSLLEFGANPGRGGHALAKRAADEIYQTRVKLASFFGLNNPKRVLFFQNATGALNQGLKGLMLKKGDHVITTSYEHNSVRRPLEYLKKHIGIEISYVKPDHNGEIPNEKLISLVNENTKLLVVTHGSNLTGMILPVKQLGEFAKVNNLIFMVDASQTAGILPINMEELHIDLLAFAGHKGLMGPQGTGALLVRGQIEMEPLLHGGTGSHSEGIDQPTTWPERFESGTLNTPGIVGLGAGLDVIKQLTLKSIYEEEARLTKKCLIELSAISGLTVYGPELNRERLAVIPFTIDGIDSHEIAMILDQHYGIAVRAGIHCSPLAHESIGTLEHGAVRISFGTYNTEEEIDKFIKAIEEIKAGFLV